MKPHASRACQAQAGDTAASRNSKGEERKAREHLFDEWDCIHINLRRNEMDKELKIEI